MILFDEVLQVFVHPFTYLRLTASIIVILPKECVSVHHKCLSRENLLYVQKILELYYLTFPGKKKCSSLWM